MLQQELRGGPARRVTNLSLSIVGEDDVFPQDDAVSDNDGIFYESGSEQAGQPWMVQLQEAMKGALNPDYDTETEVSSVAASEAAEDDSSGPRRRVSRSASMSGPRRGSLDIGGPDVGKGGRDAIDDAIDAVGVEDEDERRYEADPDLPEDKKWSIARRPREACMIKQFIKGKRVEVEGDGVGSMQTGVRLQANLPSMFGIAKYSLDCCERITQEKGAAAAAAGDAQDKMKRGPRADVDLDELTTKLAAGTYIVNVRILSIQDLVEPELPGLYGVPEPDPVRDVQEGHEQRAAVHEAMYATERRERHSMDDDGDEPSTPFGPPADIDDDNDEEERAKYAAPTGRLMKPLIRVVTP